MFQSASVYGSTRSFALVVGGMAMSEAEVELAGVADDGDQLALLAARPVAAVGEHLL